MVRGAMIKVANMLLNKPPTIIEHGHDGQVSSMPHIPSLIEIPKRSTSLTVPHVPAHIIPTVGTV